MKEIPDTPAPSDDERRRAACRAMAAAPGLIRFASRYTRSIHDAEDAYQRAMEIALTRAPVTEPRRFMAWLHTVLRNEALAVASARRREGPSSEADVSEVFEDRLEDGPRVDAVAEWRERYRTIQDGLAALTEAQRVCLMLQTAGASYERIHQITGFSMRKVERSVLEGRKGLAAWELRLVSGEACDRLDGAISRVAAGTASAKESRSVSRHIGHCGHCRALLRSRRESNEWLVAMVPVALLGGQALTGAPDPGPAIAWWERVADGATVRMGNAVQMAMDLPTSALAKVGAGTAAIVVAGTAALPLVSDEPPPVSAPATASASATTSAAVRETGSQATSGSTVASASAFAAARRAATVAKERERVRRAARADAARRARDAARARTMEVAARRSVAVSTPTPTATQSPKHREPSAPSSSSVAASSSAAVALEFGP